MALRESDVARSSHPAGPDSARERSLDAGALIVERDKVRRLPRGPQGPGNVARGHGQRVDQHPGATAAVRVFTSLAPAGLRRFGGRFALKHLHTSFFIAADDQAALLIGLQRLDVELANRAGFRIEMLIVTVEPVLCAREKRVTIEITRG